MMWWATAFAAEFAVLPSQPILRPGLPGLVWVGSGGERPPAVEVEGGAVRFGRASTTDGIWPLLVTPSADARTVRLVFDGTTQSVELPVGWTAESDLVVPRRIEGVVQSAEPLVLHLTGPALPRAEDLEVVLGEGVVESIEAVDGGLDVRLRVGDSPFPRHIPFGVRETGTSSRPAFGTLRLRARPRIPLSAEPGSTIRVDVGGRSYGPFDADEEGRVVVTVDQYPGERSAKVRLTDDLGNTTASVIPLTTQSKPTLIAVTGDRALADAPPRLVYLSGLGGDGRPWRGNPPTCRTPVLGEMEVLRVDVGTYAVPIEGRLDGMGVDVRLECRLGPSASTSLRIGAPPGVASRVLLQVWPTELSTDLPEAEVRVALEDARGERLDAADVALEARLGEVTRRSPSEAEYDGARAVEKGVDTIVARYEPSASVGPAAFLVLGWDWKGESARLHARVTDRLGVPVEGAPVVFEIGSTTVEARSGPKGWAVAGFEPERSTAMELRVRAGRVESRALMVPDTSGPVAPGDPLLSSQRGISLSPGRVAGISVNVDPPILRTGRASVAWVSVLLEDRSGNPVTEEDVQLEASEGSVGSLIARPDGTYMAEYVPIESDRPREVTITASTDQLRSTARLTLEPRLGTISLGPYVGWVSNFGTVSSPVLGVDLDLRTRLLAESVIVRLGVAGHGFSATGDTGLGGDAQLIGTVVPGTFALLLRQDRGGLSFWGGAGGQAGVHTLSTRFAGQLVSRGSRFVTGGTVLGGAGYRLGLGDLTAEARWSWLPGPGGEVGFTGNIAGLSAGIGFRLVY